MISDLMFPMTGTSGDENALAAAIGMAESLGAHLSVIESVTLPVPTADAWGLSPDTAMATLYESLRETGKSNADRLRARLQRESISWEVRVVESFFVEAVKSIALHARYADMTVMTAVPRNMDGDTALAASFVNSLLFESGRPLLLIPPHFRTTRPLTHAVVAWQPGREATRALHDALPLLRNAATVDVVMIDPVIGESRHGEQPGADIATHLARHGLRVNIVVHAREGETVAMALMRHAVESGAQLLVAGGYGHSRLREWLLGGTTRELLEAMRLPTLFSH